MPRPEPSCIVRPTRRRRRLTARKMQIESVPGPTPWQRSRVCPTLWQAGLPSVSGARCTLDGGRHLWNKRVVKTSCACLRRCERTSSSLLPLPSWRWHPTMIAGNRVHRQLRCGYQTMPPVTLPDTTCGPIGQKCGSGVAIIGRNEYRLHNDFSPWEICQLCVVVSDGIMPMLDQSTLVAVKGVLESEGHATSITKRGQTIVRGLMTVPYGQLISELGRG